MKTLIVALTTVALLSTGASVAFAAAPVLEKSASIADCNALDDHPEDWSTQALSDKLAKAGVKVDSIGVFGNCFQVSTVAKDGKAIIQLYDPSTLDRIL